MVRTAYIGVVCLLVGLALVACRPQVVREERLTQPATITSLPPTVMPTATAEVLVTATPRIVTATFIPPTPTDLPLVTPPTAIPTLMAQLPSPSPLPILPLGATAAPPILAPTLAVGTPVIRFNTVQTAAPVNLPVGVTPFRNVPTLIPVTGAPVINGSSAGNSFNIALSGDYQLVVAKHGEDSLFVMNAGARPFPMAGLTLQGNEGEIEGDEWGIDFLETGECVTAWKDGGNPEPPDISCEEVGPHVIRDGPSRFWKSDFDIYYLNEHVSHCEGQHCSVEINV